MNHLLKIFKYFYIPFTLSSFVFIHIVNLIKGNVFELDIHLIEKLSLITNFFGFSTILFLLFIFLNKYKSQYINGLKIFIYLSFFFFLFSSQIYGVYTLPVPLAPRSIIVISIFSIFIIIPFIIKKFLHLSFLNSIELILRTISPLSLLVVINILTIPTPKNLNDQNIIYSSQKIDDNNPMIVLLFDMLPDDRFKYELDQDSLPNFESFINDNIYFTNAYSPGSHTVTSANSIFYGKLITEIDRTNLLELKYKIIDDKNWHSSSSSSSIFSDLTEFGWKTNIIAAANMSYSKWFGEYINSGYFYLIAPPIKSISSFVLYPYNAIYNYLIPPFIKNRLKPRKVIRMEGIMKAIDPTIENISKGLSNFLFVHFPIPHHAFVYDRHGNYDLKYSNIENDFTQQLYFTDTIFGNVIRLLKKHNIYNISTIMILSDHGWSHDPVHYQKKENITFFETQFDDETFLVKVPLLLKLPDQKDKLIINEKYSLIDLRSLINNIIKDKYDNNKLLNYINSYANDIDSIYFTRHEYHDEDWQLLNEKVIKIRQ